MAAQRGRLMLLYTGTLANKTLVAGVKSTTLNINNQIVDVSTKDTDGWRELLEDGSLKFFSIACSGIFQNDASAESLMQSALNNTINSYVFVLPNGATIDGDFQATGYSRTGEHEGAETFSMTLESTGEPTYTPAS